MFEEKKQRRHFMHSIWSGSISFGLVNIPIQLLSGSDDIGLNLTMLHKPDLSPIRYAKICRAEGTEVESKDIVKGYEIQKGNYVVLNDKDFEKANVRATHMIDIVQFSDENEIDLRYFEKPYYLQPVKGGEKAYALLRQALTDSKKVAVATFVIRNRAHLAVVKPVKQALVLNTMRFESEVRDIKDLDLPDNSLIRKQELEMAKTLIDQLTREFKPSEFHDTYIEELKKVIAAKAEGKSIPTKGKVPKDTRTQDLMATLKASLQKKQAPKSMTRRRPKVVKQSKQKSA